jgi:preprotein translocase subunit YajC
MTIISILLQTDGASSLIGPLFWVAIIAIFYFFMIRPQAKKAKEAKKFREALEKGTKVVTIGGIHGKVVEVHETTVLVDTGGAKLRIEKSAISPDANANEQALSKQ